MIIPDKAQTTSNLATTGGVPAAPPAVTTAPSARFIIGKEEVSEATNTLEKYKQGKANLEQRIVSNEQWFKMQHWDEIKTKDDTNPNKPRPKTAWLFNSICNKHADAMDSYPEPSVLPRAQDDDTTAQQLSAILPVVLEYNDYEQVYSDTWWYKLKQGTGVKKIFWNTRKNNGLGDIDIRKIDLLNLFWEPGITDIQNSRNLFHVELIDNDVLKQMYPDQNLDFASSPTIDTAKYIYDDSVDTSNKSSVIDWYYKKSDGVKDLVHYCKYVNDVVLYASENDPQYEDKGFYDHGKYPFVFDTLFVEEGTPAGFGYIDIMKSAQEYIDRLNSNILENSLRASKKRYVIRKDGCVNEEEFLDTNKDVVHFEGNLDDMNFRELETNPLSDVYMNVLQNKIDELKETSGNRDFSQGSTNSGVTAASAIAALQEAGSKLSRDMLKSAYRAFVQECYFCIELMRQFYDEPRRFRITGKNGYGDEFVQFDNSGLQPQKQGGDFGLEFGERIPVFDIQVTAAKKSTYSRMAQNEMALQFYQLGFFNPQMSDQALATIDMMDFDGKDKIKQTIAQNGTMYQQLQQMQQQMLQMATIIDGLQGTNISQGLMTQQSGGQSPAPSAVPEQSQSMAQQAQERAANVAAPR